MTPSAVVNISFLSLSLWENSAGPFPAKGHLLTLTPAANTPPFPPFLAYICLFTSDFLPPPPSNQKLGGLSTK